MIPGQQVDELAAELSRAEASTENIRTRLAEEREDAKRLEPRRRQAVREHAAAVAGYETVRDEARGAFEAAERAGGQMQDAWALVAAAKSKVESLGAQPEVVTPSPLHRLPEGRRTLEALRERLRAAL